MAPSTEDPTTSPTLQPSTSEPSSYPPTVTQTYKPTTSWDLYSSERTTSPTPNQIRPTLKPSNRPSSKPTARPSIKPSVMIKSVVTSSPSKDKVNKPKCDVKGASHGNYDPQSNGVGCGVGHNPHEDKPALSNNNKPSV